MQLWMLFFSAFGLPIAKGLYLNAGECDWLQNELWEDSMCAAGNDVTLKAF